MIQGMRTVIAGQSEPTQAQVEEGKLYNETWTWYPDDMPLRSLYGGDSRAALVCIFCSCYCYWLNLL